MINRSRIPTIFSIYMLDVICCALGCVILLWQLKYSEAEEAEANWKEASAQVLSATGEAASLQSALRDSLQKEERLSLDLARARKDRDDANRLVALSRDQYDDLLAAMHYSEAMLKTITGDRDKLRAQYKLSAADLAGKVKDNAELLLQLTATEKKADALGKQMAAQKLDAAEAARRLQEQLLRLQAIEGQNRDLAKLAASMRGETKDVLAKLKLSELRIKLLENDLERGKLDRSVTAKDIEAARALIAALQDEKLVLIERAKAVAAEAEQRFAGIALTGQNVLFLVDMSGSMAMMDESTLDPDKWPLVCETVAQLMRSIKGLQFYQVLLFSDKVRYPLGSPATWLKYNPTETPKKAAEVLKAVRPDGETNMHAVFAEAFRYREAGLDTIYVLSDGLPNAGDGLPASVAKLSEAEQTAYLSRHLRSKLKNEWNRPIAGQKRVRINSIGFFFESPDVGAFLWALSREHDGSFVGMSK
jgi:hypothetical protein